MRSLTGMGVAVFPSRALLISACFVALIWKVWGQDPPSNTTLNPDLVPSPTQIPSDQPPLTPPANLPSTTPGDITCCYVQSQCNNCSEVYNVNSITYCCPNCRGMVLVTDLVCRCYMEKDYNVQNLQCKLSNVVVGGYDALRPSYYDAGRCGMMRASSALLSLLLFVTVTV